MGSCRPLSGRNPQLCSAQFLFLSGFRFPLGIWSDCAAVVRKVRELVQGSPVPPRCPNRDLWLPLAAELQFVPEGFCITHVPSHEDPACHDDPVAQRAVSNNNLVDSVASSVNLDRSPSFWRTWTKLRDHLADQHRLVSDIMQFHLAVAHRATQAKPTREVNIRYVSKPSVPPLLFPRADGCAIRLWEKLGRNYVQEVRRWLEHLQGASLQPDAEAQWVSTLQLFIHFMLFAGVVPPTYRAESKRWERNEHAQVQLPRRVQWFARHLRELQSSLGGSWTSAEGRPESSTLFHRSTVVPLRCRAAFIFQVDEYITKARRGAPTARLSWRTIPLPR